MSFHIKPITVSLVLLGILLSLLGNSSKAERKVVILGIDGMDPKLLKGFMDEGHLPNFQRLVSKGDFKPLQTTMPPLSPVAWSTFITGMDPGGHGIFDFLHRDPRTLMPQLSMSKVIPATRTLDIGSWVIPLAGVRVEQLRKGRPFWEVLEERGVPTTMFRIPVNFPPSSSGKSLSGMGTPDMLGTPGTFSFYTSNPPDEQDVAGGRIFEVKIKDNRVDDWLVGPKNQFRRVAVESNRRGSLGKEYIHPELKVGFSVRLDPQKPLAKFVVEETEFILQQGEWSDWIRIDFAAVPYLVNVSAIVRFYLQELRPDFRLYVTPLQINPEDPAMPISTPESWSRQLSGDLDYFYTQELPEDTKALSAGVFTNQEFWQQTQFVAQEERRALDYLLERFQEGLLFTYFSTVDQGCHMLWRLSDQDHPGFSRDSELSQGIRRLYRQMDEALAQVIKSLDDSTTLIVMSDHGFAPFYWGVNLNSWLLEKGYVRLRDPTQQGNRTLFSNVDWQNTQAYALGLNGIYVNLRGREKYGVVAPGTEYQSVLRQLEEDLLAMVDPRNGQQAVTLVIQTDRDFQGPHVNVGPDIIVGYNRGYRSSWESPLGKFPKAVFVDNDDAWSGDHSIDYRLVPGILASNRTITLDDPALFDLTVAVLDEFGVLPPAEMIGKDCLARRGPQGVEKK